MEGVYVTLGDDGECVFAVEVFRTLEEATAKALEFRMTETGWRSVVWVPWGTEVLDGTEVEIDRSGWAEDGTYRYVPEKGR